MKISINEQEYTLQDTAIMNVLDRLGIIGFTMLEKLPLAAHMMLTSLARKELYDREKGDPDHKERYRPAKKEDPIKHLEKIMKEDIATKFPDMRMTTNDNGEIIEVRFENTSTERGSLAVGRD